MSTTGKLFVIIAAGNWILHVIACIHFAFASTAYEAMMPIFALSHLIGLFILVGSLLRVIIGLFPKSTRRAIYECVFVMYLLLYSIQFWSVGQHFKTRQAWFLKTGIHDYMKKVEIITHAPGALSDKGTNYSGLFPDGEHAYGLTNNDGSITISFSGRDNSLRAGYLYHSGPLLTTNPWALHTNDYFYHITNGWYEY